jgi:hypothetical protein
MAIREKVMAEAGGLAGEIRGSSLRPPGPTEDEFQCIMDYSRRGARMFLLRDRSDIKRIMMVLAAAIPLLLVSTDCSDRLYENPLDPSLALLPPGNVRAVFVSDTLVTITWTDPNEYKSIKPGTIYYVIEEDRGGSGFLSMQTMSYGTSSANIAGRFSSAVSYNFRIRIQVDANRSSYSNNAAAYFDFLAPTGLAIASFTENAATLQWSLSNAFATWIMIEQSTGGGSEFVIVDSVAATSSSRTISGNFRSDSTYFFRVWARSYANSSAKTNPVSSVPNFPAPANLAINSMSETAVGLQWQSANTRATHIVIERSINTGASYVPVDSVPASVSTATLTEIHRADSTYYYRVRAKSTLNRSTPSAQVYRKFDFPAPSGLVVNSLSQSSANLQWQNSNTFASRIDIERSTNGFGFDIVDTASSAATSATVPGPYLADSSYYFRLRARSNFNASGPSTVATRSFGFKSPENLQEVFLADTAVRLTWQYTGTDATGFEIEKSVDGGTSYARVQTVPRDSTGTTIGGEYLASSSYRFRVRAISGFNTSAFVTSPIMTLSFAAPTELAAASITETAVGLQWKNANPYADRVIIEMSVGDQNRFAAIDSVPPAVVSKVINRSFHKDSTYYFRVGNKTNLNRSAYSNTLSIAISFPPPAALSVSAISETAVTLQWQNTNSQGKTIVIEQSNDGGTFIAIDSIAYPATSKSVTGLFHTDSLYYFRVAYKADVNRSLYSNTAVGLLVLPAPSEFAATSMDDHSIQVRWHDNSLWEQRFVVELSNDNLSYTPLVEVPQNAVTASAAYEFSTTQTYYLRVRASTNVNTSRASNTIVLTHPTLVYAGGDFGISSLINGAWANAGGSVNGYMNAMVQFNNELYVGGKFDSVGGVAASNIARWNGIRWLPVGPGLDGEVMSLVVYNNNLIAGGDFAQSGSTTVGRVAQWNGLAWNSLGSGIDGAVRTMTTIGTGVLAGGDFTQVAGQAAGHLGAWNGTSWSPFGGKGVDGPVYASAYYNGSVCVAGSYYTAGGAWSSSVCLWNSTYGFWDAMGCLSTMGVCAIAPRNGYLYFGLDNAAGLCDGQGGGGIAKWNGSWSIDWHSGSGERVTSFFSDGSGMLAGANTVYTGGYGGHVLALNGTSWAEYGPVIWDQVRCVARYTSWTQRVL